MASDHPLDDLLAATRVALAVARKSFDSPEAEIDHALAELGGLEVSAGRKTELLDVVNRHLPSGGVRHAEAGALLKTLHAAARELPWVTSFYPEDGHPDISRFADGYACSMIVTDPLYAKNALATSRTFSLNYTIQAPHTLYPEHAHAAVELYYVISGNALWKRGSEPWVTRYPGDIILHSTGMRHAMSTGDEPLVACAIWVSHTDAPIVIVRS